MFEESVVVRYRTELTSPIREFDKDMTDFYVRIMNSVSESLNFCGLQQFMLAILNEMLNAHNTLPE